MDTEKSRDEMVEMKIWAVVGVTARKNRFGYKIWRILQKHGYEVYGINPNYNEIEGEKIYRDLKELPKKVDVVNMVVAPRHGIHVLEDAKELGIENIFFQPGSHNNDIIQKSNELGFNYVKDCIYAILKSKE